MLLVLSAPAVTDTPVDCDDDSRHLSATNNGEGEPEDSPLLLPLMEMLDSCEAVPPAVLRFPRPVTNGSIVSFCTSEEQDSRDREDRHTG